MSSIPTFSIRADQTKGRWVEGSVGKFIISTQNVIEGTTLDYYVGVTPGSRFVSANDIVGGLTSGKTVVGSNGEAYINVAFVADQVTEGNEELVVVVNLEGEVLWDVKSLGISESITVYDTSTTPKITASAVSVNQGSTTASTTSTPATPINALTTSSSTTPLVPSDPTYALTASTTNINEGSTAKFTLVTKNLAAGTEVGYQINGLSSEDIVGGNTSGSVIIGSNGQAIITVALAADKTTEGIETLNFSIKDQTVSVTVNDTSIATDLLKTTSTTSASVNTVAALGTSQVLVASVVTDGLYKANTKQAQYAVSDNSLSVGDSLDGAVILKSSNGKLFTPKGVLAVIDEGDKTGLVTKTKTGWQEQLFGSDGVAEKALVSFNTTQLFAKETSIGKDINKDGHVGNFITNIFDPDGLYKSASGAITYTRGGLSIGDVLSGEHDIQISAGKNWTTKSQIVGFVEHDGMGEILMKSGKKYSAQVFHTDTGLIQGGITSVSAANVLARESYYGADLNLDSLISPIGQQAMPTDWTQKNGSWF